MRAQSNTRYCPLMPRLRDLQHRMFRAIAEAHAHAPIEMADLVRSYEKLQAADRVGIYAGMYCARLTEALTEDYPRVAAVLGPAGFAAAAHEYVSVHPSRHPSLRWFGAELATFLAAHPVDGQPPYLPDLARLEWARLAVFDAPDAATLDQEHLRRIPVDAWPAMRFVPIPALEMLHVAWPVHRIWEGVVSRWAPEDIWLRVWRHGDHVFQVPMDAIERWAFDCLRAGDDFGTLCDGIASMVDPDHVAAMAGGIVLRWVEDGLLTRLIVD